MLGALQHAAQLSALRSGPIRPSAARPVLRHQFVSMLAKFQPRVQSVLPAVRDASAVSAGRVRTCLSAAVFRAAGQSVCRLPAASLLRSERSGRSLSLTGFINPGRAFAGIGRSLACRGALSQNCLPSADRWLLFCVASAGKIRRWGDVDDGSVDGLGRFAATDSHGPTPAALADLLARPLHRSAASTPRVGSTEWTGGLVERFGSAASRRLSGRRNSL